MQSTHVNNDHPAYKQFLRDAVGTLPTVDPLGDLDHPVHPLFAQRNFCADDGESTSEMSNSAYAAMLPALRLATRLITEPSMCKPFDHIANGFVTGDAQGNMYIASGTLEGTQQGYTYVQDVFQHMISYVRFSFSLDNSHLGADDLGISHIHECSSAWAEVPCWEDTLRYSPGQVTGRSLRNLRIEVSFRGFFYTYFSSDIHHDTPPGRMSALFEFTILLLHELTHTFAFLVENAWPEIPRDPRWAFEDVWQEHGYAYEQWFFNGKIMSDVALYAKLATDASIFPADVLVLAETMLHLDEPDVCWEIVEENVGMTYLRADVMRLWFLKATWCGIQSGVVGHNRILKEARRSSMVMRTDGILYVTYDDDFVADIRWKPGPSGVNKWFHEWSLVKAGCAHNNGETINCIEKDDEPEELEDFDEFDD